MAENNPLTLPGPGSLASGQHGWQYYASSSLEFPLLAARFTIQFGVQIGTTAVPHPRVRATTTFVLTLRSLRVWRRERRAPESRRLRARAVGPERTLARVCREAGATVSWQAKFRDVNVTPMTSALLRCEPAVCLCSREHSWQSTSRSGAPPAPNTSHIDGAALLQARRDMERKYAELLAGDSCRLVVVGIEAGARWSAESTDFVSCLAAAKAAKVGGVSHFRWSCRGRRVASTVTDLLTESVVFAE